MKKFILFIISFNLGLICFSQQVTGISGTVKNANSFEFLPNASVTIENNQTVITDKDGKFTLTGLSAGNYQLVISFVGYEPFIKQVTVRTNQLTFLDIYLDEVTTIGNEIVISASKKSEKITKAPASIHVINEKELNQFPGSNVGELFARVQGIEFTRSGVDQITFNARGFHSAFNNKVMQLVDGRNSMAALSGGLPLFHNGTANKDDLERIEIVLGPQNALYGPNAHNALFNYITKDPRKYGGTTAAITLGTQSQFSMRVRQASKINEKWAYKFSGEYSKGKEFEFYDSVYAGGDVYGPVAGIPERNVDFNYRHLRGEGSIYYSLNKKSDLIITGGASTNDFLQVTTAARNQMKDFSTSYIQARYVHPRFFVNVYNTWGNIGSSYVISNYTRDFWNRTHSTLPRTDSMRGKLTEAEAEGFAMRYSNRFKEKGQRLNAEAQYNHFLEQYKLFVVAGLNMQIENPNGFGLNLVDVEERIRIKQHGAVLQLEKQLPVSFRLSAAARYDYHSVFGNFFSPRIALLKDVSKGSFRISYGKAYAMPSILNQFAKIGNFLFGNGNGITYIPVDTKMENEIDFRKTTSPLLPEEVHTWELGYKAGFEKLFIDVSAYRSLSKNFLSPQRSVAGRALFVGEIPVNPAFPGIIQNDTLKNAFFNTFFNYGNVLAYGIDGGLEYRFSELISFAIKYSWFGSDITKKRLQNDANKDGIISDEETALNAPQHRGNISLRFSNFLKGKAFVNITARYVEQYDFYSGNQVGSADGQGKRGIVYRDPLPPIIKNFDWGALGGFTSIDLNVSYNFNKNATMNAGVSNLFNTKQIEFVASPSIGRLISLELKIYIPG